MAAHEILIDRARPLDERVRAAEDIQRGLERDRGPYQAWQAVCGLVMDTTEPIELRLAAVRAIAGNPAAAPNQLVRFYDGDPERALRREANALLRRIGVAELHHASYERMLSKARVGSDRMLSLANLAMSFGFDDRSVAVYRDALRDPDDNIRALGVRGLAMLGELTEVVVAIDDRSPLVIATAVEMLGYYTTRAEAEVAAVVACAGSPEATVQKAARKAMRRIGIKVPKQPRTP